MSCLRWLLFSLLVISCTGTNPDFRGDAAHPDDSLVPADLAQPPLDVAFTSDLSQSVDAVMDDAAYVPDFKMPAPDLAHGSPSLSRSLLTVSPTSVVADGIAVAQITVTLMDEQGVPVPDVEVSLGVTGAAMLDADHGTTDARGVVTTSLRSTVAAAEIVKAAAGGLTLEGAVRFVAGPAVLRRSALRAMPDEVYDGGTSFVVLDARDAFGNPVSTQPAHFVVEGDGAVLEATDTTTDSAGRARIGVRSSSPGRKRVLATIGGLTLRTTIGFLAATCEGTIGLPGRPEVPLGDAFRVGSLLTGDWNGDGHADFAFNQGGTGISIVFGDGQARFGPPTPVALTPSRLVQAIDLDRDGDLDLIGSADGVHVLLGHGDGRFDEPVIYPLSGTPFVADVDGDGFPDLVTDGRDRVRVALGLGDGRFGVALEYVLGKPYNPDGLQVADLNGDGKADLLTAYSPPQAVPTWTPWLSVGDGSFTQVEPVTLPASPSGSSTIADLDRDGVVDLLLSFRTGYSHEPRTSLCTGRGDGSFNPPRPLIDGDVLRAQDLDRDGDLDLVLRAYDLDILEAEGGAYIAAGRAAVSVTDRTELLGFADFDENGVLDLVLLGLAGVANVIYGEPGLIYTTRRHDQAVQSNGVLLADLDGDAVLDVLTYYYGFPYLSSLLGRGDGSLAAATTFRPSQNARGVALVDYDGDGLPDLVTAGYGLSAQRGLGDGSFADAPLQSSTLGVTDLKPLGSDAEGRPLIAGVCRDQRQVVVLTVAPDGILSVLSSHDLDEAPVSLLVADLSGDGQMDVLVLGPTLELLLGDGTGQLSSPTHLPISAYLAAAGDLDGDGIIDLALGFYSPNAIGVLFGLGDGAFAPPVTLDLSPATMRPAGLAVADLDRDGLDDIVFNRSDAVMVVRGRADRTLSPPLGFANELSRDDFLSAPFVAIGDLDGDGRFDIVSPGYPSGVSINLQRGCFR